ncbi:hypothetical protein ASV09_21160 [Klebsiella aerogenes]|nr:hypothetical protein YA26_15340 [Klebsiella aerogenes]KTI26525.1 hypothetical protein ASV09_21160 [Klebsiella aerogenes]
MFTQRLGIHFSSEDVKNPCHFECPHRLSDKLLKSSCNAAFSSPLRGHVYYVFLIQSQAFIFTFLCRFSALLFTAETLLTRRLACRCSVSVEAHYREF